MVEQRVEAGFVDFEIEAKGNGRYPTRDAAGLSGGSHNGYALGPCGPLSAKKDWPQWREILCGRPGHGTPP
jgi:hypothetical protein